MERLTSPVKDNTPKSTAFKKLSPMGKTVPQIMERGQLPSSMAKPYTILTCDPSMTAWGWAVIDYSGKILHVGCIKTKKLAKKLRIRVGDDDCRRVSEINSIIRLIVRQNNVNLILGELPGGGSKSAVSAKALGEAKAMLQSASDYLEIPIEWYSEGDSKKCLLNKLSATKQETIDAISQIYQVPWFNIQYKNEAVADAIAVYHVALHQSTVLKFFKNK